MDKYIIDGVEYSYGEEVEVRGNDGFDWDKRIFVGYIKNATEPIICVTDYYEEEFKNGDEFRTINWKYIRKIQIDPVEIETYVDKYFYTVCNTLIALGLIVIIMSPFIINYFTK